MEARLRVYRQDPETQQPPHFQTYTVEVPDYATVLDALLMVREQVDGTLSLRCSCRSAICGSCAMRLNGHTTLACKTKLARIAPQGQEILVEPMQNMAVIKDLVVDMGMFWDKIRAVQPWLHPTEAPPEQEYRVPNEPMLELAGVMNCIMCGACVSDCTVMVVDKSFLGPAALAKAYRFVGDPRDGASRQRLKALSEPSGIWDCTHCFECVQQCPKGVAPMDRILALRRQAMAAGYRNNAGTRHSDSFARSVAHSGWLDETTLLLDSVGFDPKELLAMLPLGLRALPKGKVPLPRPFHKARPGAEHVGRLFEKLEATES